MKNISGVKKRILEHLGYAGISKNRFYKKTGIANGTLDKETGLSEMVIEKYISTFPEIDPGWLLTGKGDMIKKSSSSDSDNPESMNNNDDMVSTLKKLVESQDELLDAMRKRIDELEYKNSWLEKERTKIKSGEVPK